jgi:polyisoprenoid-binding protein YceI
LRPDADGRQGTRPGPDPRAGQRAGFSATAEINRADLGIDRWSGGGAVVGGNVSIRVKIEAALQE